MGPRCDRCGGTNVDAVFNWYVNCYDCGDIPPSTGELSWDAVEQLYASDHFILVHLTIRSTRTGKKMGTPAPMDMGRFVAIRDWLVNHTNLLVYKRAGSRAEPHMEYRHDVPLNKNSRWLLLD